MEVLCSKRSNAIQLMIESVARSLSSTDGHIMASYRYCRFQICSENRIIETLTHIRGAVQKRSYCAIRSPLCSYINRKPFLSKEIFKVLRKFIAY